MKGEQLKAVRWLGASREDVRSFPQVVRLEIGHALYAAQKGETDPARKRSRGSGGAAYLRS
jgi:phage-related protein